MAKDSEHSVINNSSSSTDSDSNGSFVKKVKSRVSGFLPTSISKWFGANESHVRQRDELDEDDDDESLTVLPPTKRIKSSDADITATRFYNNSISTPIKYSNVKDDYNSNINSTERRATTLFPEPVAGPSGIKSRKLLAPAKINDHAAYNVLHQEIFNGDKYSFSGESSSGYSSMRVESKEKITGTNEMTKQKQSNINNSKQLLNTSLGVKDRSLFSERSPQANSSLSTRQPSFSASVFGSPNFVDRTLSSKRIMNSPFYNGRTIYGGASAYSRHLTRPATDIRSSVRNSVQIKPINDKVSNDNTSLSKTARRILDTLEQYTTPISDAKKIPHPSTRKNIRSYAASPYIRKNNVASNKELQVPTVPDLLKMKLKERLQDSTVSVRQIATSSKSSLNTEEYRIRMTDEDTSKYTNKIRNKASSVTQNEHVENVQLPEIQLPISTLPKFDFSLPIQTTAKSILQPQNSKQDLNMLSSPTTPIQTSEKSSTTLKKFNIETKANNEIQISKTNYKNEISKIEPIKCTSSSCTEYKFADPIVIAENLKMVKAINNFIFSDPAPTREMKTLLEVTMSSNSNFKGPENSSLTKKAVTKNNLESCIQLAKDSTGSVVDVLKTPSTNQNKSNPSIDSLNSLSNANNLSKSQGGFGDKFKIASNQWECNVCLVVNSSEKDKCVACESLKPNKNKLECNAGFGNNFKLSSDKWECSACFVRNNIADNKCVACSTLRSTSNESTPMPSIPTIQTSDFGNKFKPPTNTWECGACMIRNKNELVKCVACETVKPISSTESKESGFENFKKKSNEWECDSCMVRNGSELLKCQCCETPKPGSTPVFTVPKEKSQLSSFNFGIDKSCTTNIHGFSFGIKVTETNVLPTTSSIFGQPSSSTPPTFSFGIKPIQENNKINVSAPITEDKQKPLEAKQPTSSMFGNTPSPSLKRAANDNDEVVAPKKTDLGSSSATLPVLPKLNESNNSSISVNGDVNKLGIASSEPLSSEQIYNNSSVVSKNTSVTTASLFSVDDKTAPLFGASTNLQSLIPLPTTGTKISTVENATAFSNFKTTSENANTPTFGSITGMPTLNTTAFGGQPQDAKMFAFNNNKDSTVTPSPLRHNMLFGKPPQTDNPEKSFGFGSSTTTNSSNTGFNFTPSTTQQNAGFNFSPTVNQQTSNNVPLNAVPQNGMFNFGNSTTNTTKSGFNFGGNQAAAPAASGQGLFNFGAPANMPAAGSSGFNFASSSNAELKPNINFTGGSPAPTFNAQPNNDKPRVFRKAFRRTQR